MELLDSHNKLRNQIFDYFGYDESWRILPLYDARKLFWRLKGEGPGIVMSAETEEELDSADSDRNHDVIYTQRHLKKWVYRGEEYTMILVRTNSDFNEFLKIFSNANER
jgi:hypothetical protein